MNQYAHPEMLVTTDWVNERLNDPKIKLVEIDVDTQAYEAGHIPGSVGFNWQTQLQDQIVRDIISKEDFEELLGKSGVEKDDTVIVYGDNNNWFAAYGLWIFKIYGHADVRLMDGGRLKWLNEDDKELVTTPTEVTPTTYRADDADESLRAFLTDAMEVSKSASENLVDVRSPDEFTGKILAPPGLPETCQRGGHIPGAKNVPWVTAVAEDGTFKSADELRKIYIEDQGVTPDKSTIAYCRIGERSSHTWFALKYLLGLENVRNYDGSWTEYGNLVNAPVEK
ncbi:MAG: sulfurtransferase [Opitutae bacterium]|nr:sulfurtransferase [Opitutae bacterium]